MYITYHLQVHAQKHYLSSKREYVLPYKNWKQIKPFKIKAVTWWRGWRDVWLQSTLVLFVLNTIKLSLFRDPSGVCYIWRHYYLLCENCKSPQCDGNFFTLIQTLSLPPSDASAKYWMGHITMAVVEFVSVKQDIHCSQI